MKNLYLQLLEFQSASQPLVLATVTKTMGSTPQKPGSSALFNIKGLLYGTVGGGVLEDKIQQSALQAITTKESGYYHFNLDKEMLNGEDALCGGQIEILIDASPFDHLSVFEEIKRSLDMKIPGVLATTVKHTVGNKVSIERKWFTASTVNSFNQNEIAVKEIKRLIQDRDPAQYCEFKMADTERLIFLEPIFPPPHSIIAGAGHIGKALSHIGRLLDFEITMIDDREEYANQANLPDADHILVGDAGEILEDMDLAPDSYVVIVTRGHKDDAKALRPCIGCEAAYVGMIGSRNKVALMREEFIKKGWAEPREWKDIHAPIGLDIQSKSVEEIAISIAAQLIQVKNVKIPIHV